MNRRNIAMRTPKWARLDDEVEEKGEVILEKTLINNALLLLVITDAVFHNKKLIKIKETVFHSNRLYLNISHFLPKKYNQKV